MTANQMTARPDADAAAAADDDIDDAAYRSGLPGPLGVLDRGVARLEAVILAIGVIAMAANTVANVVGRTVFGRPLYFSEEVNQALIVLITFAGISYAARHGRHIRMSAILDMLPDGPRKLAMIAITGLTAALLFLLSWYALDYVTTQAARGRVMPALRLPVWWTLVWVPVGLFLTGLQYALTAIKNATHPGVWLSTSLRDGYGPPDEPGESPADGAPDAGGRA